MEDAWRPFEGEWGLVLGASSGFGAATARELGRRGMSVLGVHLDRKATLPQAEAVAGDVRAAGADAHFFNVNAADPDKRAQVCERAWELSRGRPLRLLLHSLAFGTLRPFVSDDRGQQTTKAQLEMTLDVMAHSLVYWVQDLYARKLLGEGSRVFAMTSSGGARVMPFYGAVSAAKAALESHVRQLTLELGPAGVAQDPRRRAALSGGEAAESRRAPHSARGRGRRDRRADASGLGLDQRERDRRGRRRGRDGVMTGPRTPGRRWPLA